MKSIRMTTRRDIWSHCPILETVTPDKNDRDHKEVLTAYKKKFIWYMRTARIKSMGTLLKAKELAIIEMETHLNH